MRIVNFFSPNFEERTDNVKFVIIHATGSYSFKKAIDQLVYSKIPNRVSCHYLIDKDGCIYRLVPEEKTAWHAGVSDWKDYAKNKGVKGLNHSSIGVELQIAGLSYDVNTNEVLTFDKPTQEQLDSCVDLCRQIVARHGVSVENVLRHSDVAPNRKHDPGNNFPWAYFKEQLER